MATNLEFSRTNDEELRIVLLGKTGSGKSATGNTILGEKRFESKLSLESMTVDCSKGKATVNGQQVAVIDTPGLFDTRFGMDKTAKDICQCISYAAPGPHVFLVVIRLGRFTKEEKQTEQKIQEIFGQAADRYSMVLFTGGDNLEDTTIEDYLYECPDMQELVSRCNSQYHVFNNKLKDKDRSQVTELLQKIRNIVKKNGGSHYTNEMFQDAERAIEEKKQCILKEKEEQIRKEKEELKRELKKKYERKREEQEMHEERREREEREKEREEREKEREEERKREKEREEREKEREEERKREKQEMHEERREREEREKEREEEREAEREEREKEREKERRWEKQKMDEERRRESEEREEREKEREEERRWEKQKMDEERRRESEEREEREKEREEERRWEKQKMDEERRREREEREKERERERVEKEMERTKLINDLKEKYERELREENTKLQSEYIHNCRMEAESSNPVGLLFKSLGRKISEWFRS